MLKDDEEIEIMRDAFEPGIKYVQREEDTFHRVFRAFFKEKKFQGSRILDLGPGHFEFLELVKNNGAFGECIEYDPAVCKLGIKRGFKVFEQDLKNLKSENVDPPYDGVICRCSINCFWFNEDPKNFYQFVRELRNLGNEDTWFWIVPCADPITKINKEEFNNAINLQDEIYREFGFNCWKIPNRLVASWYGLHSQVDGLRIYSRGLKHVPLSVEDLLDVLKFAKFHLRKQWMKARNIPYSR